MVPRGHTVKDTINSYPLTPLQEESIRALALFGPIHHRNLSQSGKNVMRSLRVRGLVEIESDNGDTIYRLAK